MTHDSMSGWARVYFSDPPRVVTFDPSVNLAAALQLTLEKHRTPVYTVWWANGAGWYGDPIVPNGFVVQYRHGDFAAFLYLPKD